MKVLSLFSGIGAFEKALKNIGMQFELVGFSEIDQPATKSYCAIHGVDESMNFGDITKVDEKNLPKDIDLVTYGFPCQDISLAGKQKGLFNEDGTQTRSGLFFEALRIIEETKPKVAIAENVKNLTSKKFSEQFGIVLATLEAAGYNNYWQVLNAKDYGIPQNRERVFIVSIRKDVDCGVFAFPAGSPLKRRLKDMLEDDVEDRFYLSNQQIDKIRYNNPTQESANRPEIKQVAQIYPNSGNPQAGRIYDAEGISPAMDTCSGGNRMPKVIVREATSKGYVEAFEGDSVNLEQPNSKTRRGRVGKQVAQTLTTSCNQAVAVAMRGRYNDEGKVEQHIEISDREYANALTTVQKDSMIQIGPVLKKVGNIYPSGGQNENVYDSEGISPTIVSGETNTKGNGGIGSSNAPKIMIEDLRIRKLTPKECFRLMGFDDEDFEKAEVVVSNTQLYKQAGNSIVVDVLEAIFKNLQKAGVV